MMLIPPAISGVSIVSSQSGVRVLEWNGGASMNRIFVLLVKKDLRVGLLMIITLNSSGMCPMISISSVLVVEVGMFLKRCVLIRVALVNIGCAEWNSSPLPNPFLYLSRLNW